MLETSADVVGTRGLKIESVDDGFGLELHAEPIEHTLLDVCDEGCYVIGCGTAAIDQG